MANMVVEKKNAGDIQLDPEQAKKLYADFKASPSLAGLCTDLTDEVGKNFNMAEAKQLYEQLKACPSLLNSGESTADMMQKVNVAEATQLYEQLKASPSFGRLAKNFAILTLLEQGPMIQALQELPELNTSISEIRSHLSAVEEAVKSASEPSTTQTLGKVTEHIEKQGGIDPWSMKVPALVKNNDGELNPDKNFVELLSFESKPMNEVLKDPSKLSDCISLIRAHLGAVEEAIQTASAPLQARSLGEAVRGIGKQDELDHLDLNTSFTDQKQGS